jgi:Reverse transcriptase (RNA-dependent DNA polymerase)
VHIHCNSAAFAPLPIPAKQWISTDFEQFITLFLFLVCLSRDALSALIADEEVFNMLDRLHPTYTGIDKLPAWFLRLGAPIFAKSIAHLFNESVASGYVPNQWKTAIITSIPKTVAPACASDFRPISITSILSRAVERYIVKTYTYQALLKLTAELQINDQFTFWPTGSTDSALISLLCTVMEMHAENKYVRVIALDFTKAFDTVRHFTLLEKMARLQVPDHIFNWIVHFFEGREHCTKYRECSLIQHACKPVWFKDPV